MAFILISTVHLLGSTPTKGVEIKTSTLDHKKIITFTFFFCPSSQNLARVTCSPIYLYVCARVRFGGMTIAWLIIKLNSPSNITVNWTWDYPLESIRCHQLG